MKDLIKDFYTAFQNMDAEKMCFYYDDIEI